MLWNHKKSDANKNNWKTRPPNIPGFPSHWRKWKKDPIFCKFAKKEAKPTQNNFRAETFFSVEKLNEELSKPHKTEKICITYISSYFAVAIWFRSGAHELLTIYSNAGYFPVVSLFGLQKILVVLTNMQNFRNLNFFSWSFSRMNKIVSRGYQT